MILDQPLITAGRQSLRIKTLPHNLNLSTGTTFVEFAQKPKRHEALVGRNWFVEWGNPELIWMHLILFHSHSHSQQET